MQSAFGFTTGPTNLPDAGIVSYNGCRFSPLFATKITGTTIKDAAQRTIKYMEYDLSVDGYVTVDDNEDDINPTMETLRELLTAQGGYLYYTGRGFDLIVNPPLPGGVMATPDSSSVTYRDVAWGPVPDLLEFQPLGGGLSAKVKWNVKVRISEQTRPDDLSPQALLQFNCETTVSLGEDYYTSLSIRGTMEVPLTRNNIDRRSVLRTVNDSSAELDKRIFNTVDLTRFKPTKRSYKVSRDKRTMEFDIELEEKPYMDLPIGCTVARGGYSVRPAKAGMGLCLWICTLRATYTVRADRGRRMAWVAFLAMLRLRMRESANGFIPKLTENQNAGNAGTLSTIAALSAAEAARIVGISRPDSRTPSQEQSTLKQLVDSATKDGRRAWLIDFSIDEGIYLDSKSVSFSASWRLVTSFSHILLASGLWRKVEGSNRNLWQASMRGISGSKGWLPNELDPVLDVIVDFGG